MRIGIDCRLWNETGVGRYIRNLVSELQKIDKKNEYVLFCLKKDEKNLREQFQNNSWSIVAAELRWHSVAEQKKFPRILEKENLDLVHFTYFSVPIGYKGKFVMTMHDMIPFSFATGKASTLPLPLYHAKRIAYKIIVKKALQKADKIIVPTHAVKKEITEKVNLNDKKIIVTYEGTSELKGFAHEENVIHKHNLSKNKYFVYVGNAYPHKNLERLLEGFLKLNSVNPDIKLVLCGRRDYFYAQLLKLPTARVLGGALVFIEAPTDSELKELYKNSLSFVSPSLMEGFALPALEAASCGTVMTLSDIPVFKELCLDTPVSYFDPKRISFIAESLETVAKLSKEKRQYHVKLGERLAASYSWKKMAEQTLNIYEDSPSTNSG